MDDVDAVSDVNANENMDEAIDADEDESGGGGPDTDDGDENYNDDYQDASDGDEIARVKRTWSMMRTLKMMNLMRLNGKIMTGAVIWEDSVQDVFCDILFLKEGGLAISDCSLAREVIHICFCFSGYLHFLK